MKLYIPEIGDVLTLTKTWKFKLHAEGRNEALGAFFNHYLHTYMGWSWIDKNRLAEMREIDYIFDFPDRGDPMFNMKGFFNKFDYDLYEKALNGVMNCNKEYIQYEKDLKIHRDEAKKISEDFLEVELPEGTVLKIDRIYIRKGAKDYSSISFFAMNLGKVPIKQGYYSSRKKTVIKKSQRFWAKLSDCNNIEFKIL